MSKIKNNLNARYFPYHGEVNLMPSKTVPDQTMSLRQILDRYSRGLPISGGVVKTPIWDGEDNDLPDPRTLDLAERQELKESIKQELESLKTPPPPPTPNPAPLTSGSAGTGSEADG